MRTYNCLGNAYQTTLNFKPTYTTHSVRLWHAVYAGKCRMNHNEEATPEHVQFVRRGVVLRVPVSKVVYFETNGNYAQVYLHDGTKGLLRITLKDLIDVYGEAVVLIHRGHLVFRRELLHVYRDTAGKYWARLRNGKALLPVGRSKFEDVRRLFEFDGVARRIT